MNTYTKNSILFFVLLLSIGACVNDKADQLKEETTDQQVADLEDGQRSLKDHDYLQDKYWSLNESPMQQRLRKIKPFPVGAVYYQQRGDDLEDIRKMFRLMRKTGLTALKQIQIKQPFSSDEAYQAFRQKVYNLALDEGISPWYYGKAGWLPITQELVDSLGINKDVDKEMPAIQAHPKMIQYQKDSLRKRIARLPYKPARPEGMGEPGRNSPYMPARLLPYFADWLEKKYGSLDSINKAWHMSWNTRSRTNQIQSWEEAAQLMEGRGFDEFGRAEPVHKQSWDFRRHRDGMKFQSELIVDNYKKTMQLYTDWDPYEPERTGGHQLFENQATNTWDLEGQAKAASVGGSFYASIHLAHHFFLVGGEFLRPVYMQARTVADMFKGGWAATWESTGGPTQWSGYNGATVDEKTIRQLFTSYLAAGLKGIGLWMWNSRGEGWEAGEYALTDMQEEVGPRAAEAGRIAKILQEQRFELWEAVDEPTIGILYSWENEAMLGRLSLGSYPLNTEVYKTMRDKKFRQFHSEARIGMMRTCMNHNVPFELVTERDLRNGLAQRYPIIYLPYVLSMKDSDIQTLMDYVKQGGRLVADVPLWELDNFGRLNRFRKNSPLTKLLGLQLSDYYVTNNRKMSIDGQPVVGQFAWVEPTTAKVQKKFDNGDPAILTNQYSKGSVTLFNFEATRNVFEPGRSTLEKLLIQHTLGAIVPPYLVEGKGMVMRRAAPAADHYFFLNESEQAQTLTVQSTVATYSKVQDVLDSTKTELSGEQSFTYTIPGQSAGWVRCEK